MSYMEKNREKRIDPTKLMEGTKSVICLLTNYKPAQWQPKANPQIASFAYGDDYHIVLKERLYLLKNFIESQVKANMRLFTDTAPLLERAWAVRAGLGWVGKSSLLISPRFGPFTFISIIIINLELEYDTPMKSQCGSCQNCIDACPTGALSAPFIVDARRCISYHTIESKMPCAIDPSPYIFGCDMCIRCCPWGVNSPYTVLFPPIQRLLQFTVNDWAALSPLQFNQLFGTSALQRAGLWKILDTLQKRVPMLNFNVEVKE